MTDSDPSEYSDKEVGKRFAEVSDMGLVPIEVLEELVEGWQQDASHLEDLRMAGLVKHKADELQSLIEDYE